MSDSSRSGSRAAAGAMGLTLLLAPLVLLREPTAPPRGRVLATAGASETELVARPFASRAMRSSRPSPSSPTTTMVAATTASPTPVTAPPTTAIRHVAAAPVTTTSTSTTTHRHPTPTTSTTSTTRPPTTAPPTHSETGEASWYRGPDGECAHNAAPLGSTIRVTNLDNGRSTTCRVAGRGPYGAGRVVDLSETTFARVASLDAGVFHARVDW